MKFITKIVKAANPPIDSNAMPKILSKIEIKSEFVWKKLTWENKYKEIIGCEICYSSPEPGFAAPQIVISPNDNKFYYASKLIESTWIQEGKYTVKFTISKDLIKEALVAIESQGPDRFVEVNIVDIPDKRP